MLGPVFAGEGAQRTVTASASRSLWPVEETDADTSTQMQERKYCYPRKGFTEGKGWLLAIEEEPKMQ